MRESESLLIYYSLMFDIIYDLDFKSNYRNSRKLKIVGNVLINFIISEENIDETYGVNVQIEESDDDVSHFIIFFISF